MTGDTKYDQVVLRKKAAEKQVLLPERWYKDKFTIVAGSTWPEDEEHLFPALRELLAKYAFLNLILIPHQPDEKALKVQAEFFKEWDTCLFSARDELKEQRILITDAVGYLAGLYLYAQVAYVGGSFRQGVHNVMEPAIFGIPVLYGPVHKNSYEAIKLAENNGGCVVRTSEDMIRWLDVFINDAGLRKEFGKKAVQFAACNTGATLRLVQGWAKILAGSSSAG
jgi:3-deoxy-D-manno-octulosonic-acid transferase